ncbi:hypothetical protein L596_026687 [Steinernema carpocapsae]|uniref:Uncharacterized protein n=1 Tax=Steinernema carpocapsae TaxID=34508 RepID=A0A4U5M232_STECR|nr:hypothetical protein L596_026687 [Steinernema carpocapsae]
MSSVCFGNVRLACSCVPVGDEAVSNLIHTCGNEISIQQGSKHDLSLEVVMFLDQACFCKETVSGLTT